MTHNEAADLWQELETIRQRRRSDTLGLPQPVTLTAAEREAIAVAAQACGSCNGFANDPTIPAVYRGYAVAATLRALLERTDCPVQDNAPKQDR